MLIAVTTAESEARKEELKAQGKAYAQFFHVTGDASLVDLGVFELPTRHLTDVTEVPELADFAVMGGSNRRIYIGGRVYWPNEIANINDPTEPGLPERFKSEGHVALIKLRTVQGYVGVDTVGGVAHIQLTEEGKLDGTSILVF